eukprot:gene1469-858_t
MGKKKAMPGSLDTTEADKATPKSIIIYRGEVAASVRGLMHEWRRVLLPWSSKQLHGKNKSLKDFVSVASIFSVTHLQLFTSPSRGTSLRIMRFFNGPTLSFRVESFALHQDIISQQRRPAPITASMFEVAPIVVLNNFSHPDAASRPEVPLLEATFRAMFPTINIQTMQNSEVRRVCLVHYNHVDHMIEIRHYFVNARTTGVSKTIKKLLENRRPTKLGTLADVDEVLEKEDGWSDTDGEGEEVPLAQPFRQHREQCRVKLVELGPRMTLRLMKVENGFASGEVLYHNVEKKTLSEVQENAHRVRSRAAEKIKRRAEQEERVGRKRKAKEDKLERKRLRREKAMEEQAKHPFEVSGGGEDDGRTDALQPPNRQMKEEDSSTACLALVELLLLVVLFCFCFCFGSLSSSKYFPGEGGRGLAHQVKYGRVMDETYFLSVCFCANGERMSDVQIRTQCSGGSGGALCTPPPQKKEEKINNKKTHIHKPIHHHPHFLISLIIFSASFKKGRFEREVGESSYLLDAATFHSARIQRNRSPTAQLLDCFRLVCFFLFPLDVLLKIVYNISNVVLEYSGLLHWFAGEATRRRDQTSKHPHKLKGSQEKATADDGGPTARRSEPRHTDPLQGTRDGLAQTRRKRKILVVDPVPALCYIRTSGLPIGRGGAAADCGIPLVGRTDGSGGAGAEPTTSSAPQDSRITPPTYTDVVLEGEMGRPVYVWVRPYAAELLHALARRVEFESIVLFSTLPPPIIRVVLQGIDPQKKCVQHQIRCPLPPPPPVAAGWHDRRQLKDTSGPASSMMHSHSSSSTFSCATPPGAADGATRPGTPTLATGGNSCQIPAVFDRPAADEDEGLSSLSSHGEVPGDGSSAATNRTDGEGVSDSPLGGSVSTPAFSRSIGGEVPLEGSRREKTVRQRHIKGGVGSSRHQDRLYRHRRFLSLHALRTPPEQVVILTSYREVFDDTAYADCVLCIDPYSPWKPQHGKEAGAGMPPDRRSRSASSAQGGTDETTSREKKKRSDDQHHPLLRTVEPILIALSQPKSLNIRISEREERVSVQAFFYRVYGRTLKEVEMDGEARETRDIQDFFRLAMDATSAAHLVKTTSIRTGHKGGARAIHTLKASYYHSCFPGLSPPHSPLRREGTPVVSLTSATTTTKTTTTTNNSSNTNKIFFHIHIRGKKHTYSSPNQDNQEPRQGISLLVQMMGRSSDARVWGGPLLSLPPSSLYYIYYIIITSSFGAIELFFLFFCMVWMERPCLLCPRFLLSRTPNSLIYATHICSTTRGSEEPIPTHTPHGIYATPWIYASGLTTVGLFHFTFSPPMREKEKREALLDDSGVGMP